MYRRFNQKVDLNHLEKLANMSLYLSEGDHHRITTMLVRVSKYGSICFLFTFHCDTLSDTLSFALTGSDVMSVHVQPISNKCNKLVFSQSFF